MPTLNTSTKNWKQYLDDCLMIWPESEESLKKVHSKINKINTDIQFTLEYSKDALSFLDILIKKVNTKIENDINYKPTDSKQYLIIPFNSCHPKHTTANVP